MKEKIFESLSYGMYAIGVKGERGPSACIANALIQITHSPVSIAVSISKDNYSNEMIKKEGVFSVSVLSENTPGSVIGALGYSTGKDKDKLSNLSYKTLKEGVPVIKENSCCWFLCRVRDCVEVITHTVFIADVIAGSDDFKGVPMTYSYYHKVIKGKAPKNAPTYRNENSEPNRYVCDICGYVYNNKEHDFQNLPEEWTCPICGAPKSVFRGKA